MSFDVGVIESGSLEGYQLTDPCDETKEVGCSSRFMGRSVHRKILPEIAQKVEKSRQKLRPMKVDGDAEVKITMSWDQNGSVDVKGGISGSVWDNHGNNIKAEIERKSDGSGSATISAGHKSEDR